MSSPMAEGGHLGHAGSDWHHAGPNASPVKLPLTMGRYGTHVLLVHAILGVCARLPKPPARIATVAWTIRRKS
jgi:hypothetical protein